MPMDWIYGLVGGVLIGCAGAFLLLGNGRVMGASSTFWIDALDWDTRWNDPVLDLF